MSRSDLRNESAAWDSLSGFKRFFTDFTPLISLIFAQSCSSRPDIFSELPKEQQDDQNQKDQSDSAAGIVSPTPAVRPGGQCSDQYED
jgi:hypothetical protein